MPWRECHVMDERLRFVARLLEGAKMAPLCGEFGISRKTGYKIFDRYKDCGVVAFSDRSRRPYRQANRLPAANRGDDRPVETRVPGLGRAEDPRETAAGDRPGAAAGDQHRPRRARSPPPGEASATPPGRRPSDDGVDAADRTQGPMRRRFAAFGNVGLLGAACRRGCVRHPHSR